MVRKKVPWFIQEIREKKTVVHRRETIWKKYRRGRSMASNENIKIIIQANAQEGQGQINH